MQLNTHLADALASWAYQRRGWDRAGCRAALGRVRHRHADDVAMAWARFCGDDAVNNPGAFPNPSGPHWLERVAPPEAPRPPRTGEACRVCGTHLTSCRCDGGPVTRPVDRVPATDDWHAARLERVTPTAEPDPEGATA